MAAPVLQGAGRRWFFKHFLLSFGVGIVSAEAWWRGYELPRLAKRDEYYRKLGVDWVRIVD